jgi:hypothetical protein
MDLGNTDNRRAVAGRKKVFEAGLRASDKRGGWRLRTDRDRNATTFAANGLVHPIGRNLERLLTAGTACSDNL